MDAARDAVAATTANLTDARRNAVAFGLDEAASGTRGTASDRARAKAILRDEATARRLFDTGNSVSQFEGGKNVLRDSAFFRTVLNR